MNKVARSLGIVPLLLLAACTHPKVQLSPGENAVARPGVVTLSVGWLKDKRKKFDIALRIKSESDQPILILLREMRCYRGNAEGELKHTFFNTGERRIDFRPGQLKSFTFSCRIGFPADGDFRIVVGRVHENPSGDGYTLGRLLAKDVEWRAQVVAD